MRKNILSLALIVVLSTYLMPINYMATASSDIAKDVIDKQQRQKESAEAATQEMLQITPTPIIEESSLTYEEKAEVEMDTLAFRAERFKKRLQITAKSIFLRYGPFYIGLAIIAIIMGNKKEQWQKLKKIGWTMVGLFIVGGILMLFSSQIVDWMLKRFNNADFRF